jgi:hypothetical protein
LFRCEDSPFNGDIPQVPNRGNRVAWDVTFVEGRLERSLENLANGDVNRSRRPAFRQQVIPIFEEVVGRDGFQGDCGPGTEKCEEIVDQAFVLFERRMCDGSLFRF